MTDDIRRIHRLRRAAALLHRLESTTTGEPTSSTPAEVEESDVSRAEYVAGSVAAAWCKHDLSVREHRCKEAAAMIRTLARQLAEAIRERDVFRAADESMQQAHHEALTRAEQAESQLAEATRRLGEVEKALRQISSDNHAGLRVQQVAQAALTKEPK